jgi:hypothetical protein
MPKRCEMPNCQGGTLIKMEHESTWTTAKFYCSNPKCGRVYLVSTTVGKVGQVAPLALIGSFAMALLTHDWDHVLDHVGETLDQIGS